MPRYCSKSKTELNLHLTDLLFTRHNKDIKIDQILNNKHKRSKIAFHTSTVHSEHSHTDPLLFILFKGTNSTLGFYASHRKRAAIGAKYYQNTESGKVRIEIHTTEIHIVYQVLLLLEVGLIYIGKKYCY